MYIFTHGFAIYSKQIVLLLRKGQVWEWSVCDLVKESDFFFCQIIKT